MVLQEKAAALPPGPVQKVADSLVLLPGNWAQAGAVGTYSWTDADDNLVGYIFGNNTFGDRAAGQRFVVDTAYEITGAYFWISNAGGTEGEVVFSVYEFDGSVGVPMISVRIPIEDVNAFPVTEGVTPDQFAGTFYVEFDHPLVVTADYVLGVDYSDLEWTAPGDGVSLASTLVGGPGGGLNLAWIERSDGWVQAGDINAALDLDIGMFPVIVPGDTDHPLVGFHLDMAGAVAEGNVAFDPDVHRVFVSGSFNGWLQPGEDAAYELLLAGKRMRKDPFYENFQNFGAFSTDLSPWTTIDTHEGETWTAGEFSFPGQGEAFAWMVMDPHQTTPPVLAEYPAYDGRRYLFSVASKVSPPLNEENKWLISPEVDVGANDDLVFFARSITVQYGLERIRVWVSVSGYEEAGFTRLSEGNYLEVPAGWTEFRFGLDEFAGQRIRFAVENVSNDAFMLFLDAVSLVDPDAAYQQDLYTLTVRMPKGEHEYKYFLVAGEPGWDLGEWEGEPNRPLEVDGPVEVNDVFGQPDAVDAGNIPVLDGNFRLYPNPASNRLHLSASERISYVGVYDTAGRRLMSLTPGAGEVSLDVSWLGIGVYFLRAHTLQGVYRKAFHIAR